MVCHRYLICGSLGLFALLAAGCGDDAASELDAGANVDADATWQDTSVVTGGDTGVVDGGVADAGMDTATPDDSSQADTPGDDAVPDNCPGGANCPCEQAVDCDISLCIQTTAGKRCAQPCVDKCPNGFDCKLVDSGATDGITICVPRDLLICNPCHSSKDCLSLGMDDAACVSYGFEGGFCGTACKVAGDCPEDYDCKSGFSVEGGKVKQCVRQPDLGETIPGTCVCNKAAIKEQLSTQCKAPFQLPDGPVTCTGKRSCGANGLSDCVVAKPGKEDCNALDDDCDGQTDEGACDDNNGCTTDSCTPGKGAQSCAYAYLDQVPCDADGNACTLGDLCNKGVCQPGKVKNCDDGNPCSEDSCLLASGCTHTDDDGLPCDDENPCTLGDACKGSSCGAGVPKTCTSSGPCLLAMCDVKTGKCAYLDSAAGIPCDDGNKCTGPDICTGGLCKSKVVDCDDGNGCTYDGCQMDKGCTHDNSNKPCDDGNKCTFGDTCKSGACVSTPVNVAVTCDDGNPCTTDACLPAKGCDHSANAAPCDDGNPCSKGDTCAESKCLPGTNVCTCGSDADCKAKEDGNACNGTLYCDKSAFPYTCQVNPKTVIVCDKGKDSACDKNLCQAKTGDCALVNVVDGAPCDADGNACTFADTCKAGSCSAGAKKGCDDSNPCTVDACDLKTGACSNAPTSGACDDGDACTDGDTCQAGKCGAGSKKSCDDKNPCTIDSCEGGKGCTYKVDAAHTESCYTGKPGTVGKGLCKSGKRTCSAEGKLSGCTGEVVPVGVEKCDGKDDDCDGNTDEGCGVSAVRWSVTPMSLGGGAGKLLIGGHGGRALGGQVAAGQHAVSWWWSRWLGASAGVK